MNVLPSALQIIGLVSALAFAFAFSVELGAFFVSLLTVGVGYILERRRL